MKQRIGQDHGDIWVTLTAILIAPEVIGRENHGFAVDYFALGVVAHELMMHCVTISLIIINRGHTNLKIIMLFVRK